MRSLHVPGHPFILANAHDVGTAKVLAALGAQAIASTSSGHAFTLGKPDMGYVSRSEALDHAAQLAAAVDVPVSGDLENGYGDRPEDVFETVRMAAAAGLAGCSIEDTVLPEGTAYDFDLAVDRIAAGVEAARSLDQDFVFVARADGVMNGLYDHAEAVRRIQAFDRAGADCVYVPAPASVDDLAAMCAATDKPVNALAVGQFAKLSRADFAAMGVARISVGSGLARVLHQKLLDAGSQIIDGDFTSILSAAPGAKVDAMLK